MKTVSTAISLIAVLVVSTFSLAPATGDDLPVPNRGAALDAAVDAVLEGYEWLSMDMHLHTDHSSDGGVFHQQEKDQRNQDTFLGEQRDQALRLQMDAVAFTDHRNFGQHYDPDYALEADNPLVDGQFLITGEEWGGGRHGTAFAIQNRIDHGSTDRVGCGLAEMSLEVAAQDGLLGIAHPKDGGADDCRADLTRFPLSHVEALRGGDNVAQEDLGFPGAGNGSNTNWYQAFSGAGGRAAAVNGSDNHFKQVWPGPSGPGGSAGHVLVREGTEAGLIEGIRARRTIGGWGAANARLVTLLDADGDGAFDALTGGHAVPADPAGVVTVAIRATDLDTADPDPSVSAGHTVKVYDDAGEIVAEAPVTAPVDTVAFELPADSTFYRAEVHTVGATQVGLPDPLDYLDTLIMSSTPVWTTAPTSHAADTTGVAPIARLSADTADFAGLADIAEDGEGGLHAVWQQRDGVTRQILTVSALDGATWGPAVVLAQGDVRSPTIAATGGTVRIAWEEHDPTRFGGEITLAESADRGATWEAHSTIRGGGIETSNYARPDLAADDGLFHLVFQKQTADGTWAIAYNRMDNVLSSAAAFSGGMTNFAVPPRELMHIPASVEPVVDARDGVIAVAWEDNRNDPTPGRSGAPDDWAIYGAISTDGGQTFGEDTRWTPFRPRKNDTEDPEGVEGNPALDADVLLTADGALHLAFTDTSGSGFTSIWAQSADVASVAGGIAPEEWDAREQVGGATEWSYQPQFVDGADVSLIWQQSTDPTWALNRATLTADGWTAREALTEGRYAGWPQVAGDQVIFTGEMADGFGVLTMRLGF